MTAITIDENTDAKQLAIDIVHAISTPELRDLIDELADLYEPTDDMITEGVRLWPLSTEPHTDEWYEIQTHTFVDGWQNVWTITEESGVTHPQTFWSAAEARESIDEFFDDLVSSGLDNRYSRSDYRVIQIKVLQ